MALDIAIVEDDDGYARTLEQYLVRFGEENQKALKVKRYKEAVSLLTNYRSEYDIILMDIDLPMMNGMDASKKIRKTDDSVCIVFITNLAQMACEGYEVDAVDFVVKPVSYADFSMKFKRAVAKAERNAEREYRVPVAGGIHRLIPKDIFYVEVRAHNIIYHCESGKIESRDTLAAVEARLKPCGFLRCNKCYLVNPRHILSVNGLKICVGNEEIYMSQSRRKEFMGELALWQSGSRV